MLNNDMKNILMKKLNIFQTYPFIYFLMFVNKFVYIFMRKLV